MIPLNGTIFGWLRYFHITASLQSASEIRQGVMVRPKIVRTRYPLNLYRVVLGVSPKLFDADVCSTEGLFVDVTEPPRATGTAALSENFPGIPYVVGRIARELQTLRNTRRPSLNGELMRSRPSRICRDDKQNSVGVEMKLTLSR